LIFVEVKGLTKCKVNPEIKGGSMFRKLIIMPLGFVLLFIPVACLCNSFVLINKAEMAEMTYYSCSSQFPYEMEESVFLDSTLATQFPPHLLLF
jgi:hypothetical protein